MFFFWVFTRRDILHVFGKIKTAKRSYFSETERKFKSPWFTEECETARRELKTANKANRKYRSRDTRDVIVEKRKNYCTVKWWARNKFKQKQRNTMHNLAKSQPKKFWSEIRKMKGHYRDQSNITADDFLHILSLYFRLIKIFRTRKLKSTFLVIFL